jgi:hypothetical protein
MKGFVSSLAPLAGVGTVDRGCRHGFDRGCAFYRPALGGSHGVSDGVAIVKALLSVPDMDAVEVSEGDSELVIRVGTVVTSGCRTM